MTKNQNQKGKHARIVSARATIKCKGNNDQLEQWEKYDQKSKTQGPTMYLIPTRLTFKPILGLN
jgi:hypothetical protein